MSLAGHPGEQLLIGRSLAMESHTAGHRGTKKGVKKLLGHL